MNAASAPWSFDTVATALYQLGNAIRYSFLGEFQPGAKRTVKVPRGRIDSYNDLGGLCILQARTVTLQYTQPWGYTEQWSMAGPSRWESFYPG